MGKIIYITGKSATGKDRIFKELVDIYKEKLKPIILYTTRPIRPGEIEGETYKFISIEKMEELEFNKKIIEERKYNTIKGCWTYATVDDGSIDLSKNNYIGIGTLESLKSIKSKFGSDVIPFYINTDDHIRIKRAVNREQLTHNYSEMCRRWLSDAEDYTESNLKEAEVITIHNNVGIDVAIISILKILIPQL